MVLLYMPAIDVLVCSPLRADLDRIVIALAFPSLSMLSVATSQGKASIPTPRQRWLGRRVLTYRARRSPRGV